MNLEWKHESFRWDLSNPDARFDMACVRLVEGVFHIQWWITDDEDEGHKMAYFQGTPEEMKAYVLALVRFGVAE